jgi:transcriptional regulator with GAF, ATPase, and Fis domain
MRPQGKAKIATSGSQSRSVEKLRKIDKEREKLNQLEKMESFRNLLLELSTRLIGVLPSRLDTEINEALEQIAQFWRLDRIILAELVDGDKELACTHSYSAPDFPQSPPVASLGSTRWFRERLFHKETIYVANVPDEIPEDELADREYCMREGFKSSLVLPLVFEESVRGAFCILSLTREYRWTEELVKELRLAGEIMASALERRKIIADNRGHMVYEQLLSEVSGTYVNLPIDEIEQHVKDDLGRLITLLGASRCVLYLALNDRESFSYELPYIWWPAEDDGFFKADNDFWRAMGKEKDRKPAFFENLDYIFRKWSKGEVFRFSSIEELPAEAERVKRFYARFGVKSYLSIPILFGGAAAGALVVATTKEHRTWPDDLIPRIRLLGEVFVNALARKRSEESLRKAYVEVRELKERIEKDYSYLAEEINFEHDFAGIVGQSSALKKILCAVRQVAPTKATVLLLGETGTGKGMMARAIHNASSLTDRPLVQVNCPALTPSLIESEFFGHEKGAFTGALTRRMGRFEFAHGTTLFLDEIGDLPAELQAKLLRVLQDGEFERVGGTTTIKTDVRIIVATNKDLAKEVTEGRFRQDLWYRLNVFPIHIPPLRERLEDIPLFVSFFVDKYAKWAGKRFDRIPQKTIDALQRYTWPGNIRELENVIERAAITSPNGRLNIELPRQADARGDILMAKENIDDIKRDHIRKILESSHWVIEGPNGAARRLNLTPSTLRYQAKKLGIERPH